MDYMSKILKRSALIIFGFLIIMLAANPASCGLGVTGAIINASVSSGEHITHSMIVSTGSADPPMNLTVSVMGFGRMPDGAVLEVEPELDKSPFSARPFLNASPSSFHLDPGGSQEVVVNCDIPSNAGDGGRYALVNVRSQPMGKGPVGIISAIDVPVKLTLKGTRLIRKGELSNLSLESPVSGQAQNISFILKNTGNYDFRPISEAILKDTWGNSLANATTPHAASSMIPTTSRFFKLTLAPKSRLPPGTYLLTLTAYLEDGTKLDAEEFIFKT